MRNPPPASSAVTASRRWLRRRVATSMSVDSRLALPVELLLAAWECILTRVGRAAAASADVLAAARLRLILAGPVPRQQPKHGDGVADVIVLSRERKHER